MSQTERRSISSLLHVPDRYATLAVAGVAALALAAALAGQWVLDRRPASPWGWALLVAGAGTFALAARRQTLERAPAGAQPAARPRLACLAVALVLAAFAFPGFSGNFFRPLPTLLWLGSLALLYVAFWPGTPGQVSRRDAETASASRPTARRWCVEGIGLSWHVLALIGILAVAALLRLYQLDAIPAEMGTDMPLKYENAREIMQGQFMIFCPRYPGREALFHYLIAAYGAVFGLGYFAIKFTSVVVGLASILALYGLARYLFDREVALIAAALLAVSRWHLILNRSGYRASLMPLMVALVLFLLARAVRRGRVSDYVLAGMGLGLGLYTYNAFMIVPVVALAALVVALALAGRAALRRSGWGLAGLGLGALGVFLPLGRYALEHPESYFFRVATRVTAVEAPLPHDLLAALAGNLWHAAAMFNLHGDTVSYINVPGLRQMGLVSGALFVCGLAYALVRWRLGHNAMLLIFLGGLLLPTALALAFPNEVPSAQRASGAIVPAYLLVALPLAAMTRRVREAWGAGTWRRLHPGLLLALTCAVLLGAELAETSQAYFEDYVRHLPGRNYAISLELARALDEFAAEGPGYVKVWPHWYDGNAVRAQLRLVPRDQGWELYELDPAQPPLGGTARKVLVIVHPEDRAALQTLRAAFSRGVTVSHRDNDGRVAYIAFYGER